MKHFRNRLFSVMLSTLVTLAMTIAMVPLAWFLDAENGGDYYSYADDVYADIPASNGLQLVEAEAINVNVTTSVVNKSLRQVVAFKVKNTTNHKIEDVSLAYSSTIPTGEGESWTPYKLNDSNGSGDNHIVDGATPCPTTDENVNGYDIEAGADATFYLYTYTGVNMSTRLDAGQYTHHIRLGKVKQVIEKEENIYGGFDLGIWYEPVAYYSDPITVNLNVYNPEVKLSVGENTGWTSMNQKNVLDLGTINLSTYDIDSKKPFYNYAIKNVSTKEDPYTHELPTIHYTQSIRGGYYGSHVFDKTGNIHGFLTDLGPGAQDGSGGIEVDCSTLVAGTYKATVVLETTPEKVMVNGSYNMNSSSKSEVRIPVKITLNGTNPNCPLAVTNLKVSNHTLSWNASKWPDGGLYEGWYCIFRKEGVETNTRMADIDYDQYEMIGEDIEATSFTDTSADSSKTYTYLVVPEKPYKGIPNLITSQGTSIQVADTASGTVTPGCEGNSGVPENERTEEDDLEYYEDPDIGGEDGQGEHEHIWETKSTRYVFGVNNYKKVVSERCSLCDQLRQRTVATINYKKSLPRVKIAKGKAAKKKFTAKWKKVSKKNRKKIGGIEIQVSGPGLNKIYTAGRGKTSKVIKVPKSKTKYKYRVRAYKGSGTSKQISDWSGWKTIKVK